MDLIEAIRTRKSIRGYKPDPVPKEILREILETANYSPSAMNTQPWEITVITGEVIEKIKQATMEKLNAGEARTPPKVIRGSYTGTYRERQVAIGIQLLQLMGITREDKEGRAEWMKRGIRFFDAPAAIIISADESLLPAAEFDVGGIAQTIALVALTHGLGTCIADQGVMYHEVVRKYTGIPESKDMVISIAIGYPDWDFPANKVQSTREPLENVVTWCGAD